MGSGGNFVKLKGGGGECQKHKASRGVQGHAPPENF